MIFKVLQDRAAESIGGDIRCPWVLVLLKFGDEMRLIIVIRWIDTAYWFITYKYI